MALIQPMIVKVEENDSSHKIAAQAVEQCSSIFKQTSRRADLEKEGRWWKTRNDSLFVIEALHKNHGGLVPAVNDDAQLGELKL